MPVFGLFGGKKRKVGRPKGPRKMATPEQMAQRAAVDEVANNPYARKSVAYRALGIEPVDDIVETEKQIIAQGLRSNPEAQREIFDEWMKSKRETRERDGRGESEDEGYGRYGGGYESGPTQQMAEMIEFTRGMKQLTKEMGGGRSGGFDIGETIGSLAQALPMVLQLMAARGPQMMPPDAPEQQNGHRSIREMMPEPAPGDEAPHNDPSLPSVDEIPGLGPGAAVPPEAPSTLPAVMDEPVTPPSPPEQEAPEADPHVQMIWQYINGCLAESNPMLSMGAVSLIQMLSMFPTPQVYQVFTQYAQMPGLKPYFGPVVEDEQHCYAVIVTLRRLCQMMTISEEVNSSA